LAEKGEGAALRILFSGTVQGVGFRYTTRRLAGGFNVTGYVKNLANGKVEVWVEGQQKELEEFVDAIEKSFERYISKVDSERVEPTSRFDSFDIAF
jgi:acylphosphatase